MGYFDNPEVNSSVICCFTVLIPPTPIVEVQPEKPEKISPLFIVIVCILGGCFLLVSYFAIIVKYCANLKKSRRPQVRMEDDLESHHEFVDGDHDGVVNHPIWYIHTVGLAQSVVEAIGAFGYKRGDGLVEGTECLVCLSEFEEDQVVRLLPKCSHAFHVECIDTWLMSHTNCPCCRAPIVASTGVVAVGTEAVPSLGSSDGDEARREVDVESGGGVETGQNVDGGTSDLRVRVENGSKKDDRHKEVEIVKNELEMFESSVLRDLSDSDWVVQNGKQPGRRSVSLDFVPASEFSYSVDDSIHSEGSEDNLMMQRHGNSCPGLDNAMCSSSKGMILSKIPFSMKRSFSTGGKLVSSRLNRTRSAILPL